MKDVFAVSRDGSRHGDILFFFRFDRATNASSSLCSAPGSRFTSGIVVGDAMETEARRHDS